MNKKLSIKNLLDSRGFSAFMATLMAIVIGLIFGYIVMLIALLPYLLMLAAKQMNLSFEQIPIQGIVETLNRAPWILIVIIAAVFILHDLPISTKV